MDNKVTKKRINDHLEYDWFKYLIILIVCIVGGYFIFSQINSDRDYETIDIFVTAYAQSTNEYESTVQRDMGAAAYSQSGPGGAASDEKKYGAAVLRSISLNVQDPLGKEYAQLLQTQGMISSDILIVGKTQMKYSGPGFIELTDELLIDYLLPAGVAIDDLEYYWSETREDLLDENGNRIPVLDENGVQKKDEYNEPMFEKVKIRTAVRVDNFLRMTGAGSVFEMNWRNTGYNDTYKDKPEEEQPDSEFYMALNPSSVSVGVFGRKAKSENAQALFCYRQFIRYYRK